MRARRQLDGLPGRAGRFILKIYFLEENRRSRGTKEFKNKHNGPQEGALFTSEETFSCC